MPDMQAFAMQSLFFGKLKVLSHAVVVHTPSRARKGGLHKFNSTPVACSPRAAGYYDPVMEDMLLPFDGGIFFSEVYQRKHLHIERVRCCATYSTHLSKESRRERASGDMVRERAHVQAHISDS